MLNKKVCWKCCEETHTAQVKVLGTIVPIRERRDIFNMWWNTKNTVICIAGKPKGTYFHYVNVKFCRPPKNCPYALEHIVSTTKC